MNCRSMKPTATRVEQTDEQAAGGEQQRARLGHGEFNWLRQGDEQFIIASGLFEKILETFDAEKVLAGRGKRHVE